MVLAPRVETGAAPETRGAARPKPPAAAFAHDTAGLDYFRTDHHHRQVVAAIVRHLAKGCSFLLVTGPPSADGELIARFLDETSTPGYRGAPVRCRPGMDFSNLAQLTLRNGLALVLILEQADELDAPTYQALVRFTQIEAPHLVPVVLLASPALAERLDTPALAFLRAAIDGRVARQRLAAEEVGTFIQYQTRTIAEALLFPPETVAAIAEAAAGDPVIVNRLAREVLAHASGALHDAAALPSEHIDTVRTARRLAPIDDAAGTALATVSSRQKSGEFRWPWGAVIAGGVLVALLAVGPLLYYGLRPSPRETASAEAVVMPTVEAVAPEPAAVAPIAAAPTGDASVAADAADAAVPPTEPAPAAPELAATPAAEEPAPPAPPSEIVATVDPAPPAPAAEPPPSVEAAVMVRRGNQLLAAGDIVSARRFFERAAATGDAAAACGVGKSFDPLFLRQMGARGLAGDAATAMLWYRKAAAAGDREAQARLDRLSAGQPEISIQIKR